MNNKTISYKKLEAFIYRVLCAAGVVKKEADIIAKTFVWFDLIGRTTQGFRRLEGYLKRFEQGLIKSPSEAQFIKKSDTIYILDGNDGFGHYLGHVAMLKAVDIARNCGVGIAGVRHSNHFGAGAYYVQLAAKNSQIGLALSNSFPLVAPYGGVDAVLGTNPFAFGAPVRNGQSILVDFSTGASAGSTIRKSIQDGKNIPSGTLIDKNGNPIVKPEDAGGGTILPFGGAKGFCLALLVEILSGVVTGAGISHEIGSMYKNFEKSADVGHFFISIDISKLMPYEVYFDRMNTLIKFIKRSKSQLDDGEILIPGETRWRNFEQQMDHGIALGPKAIVLLKSLAKKWGIDCPGDYS